jgi:hypothetical protein
MQLYVGYEQHAEHVESLIAHYAPLIYGETALWEKRDFLFGDDAISVVYRDQAS